MQITTLSLHIHSLDYNSQKTLFSNSGIMFYLPAILHNSEHPPPQFTSNPFNSAHPAFPPFLPTPFPNPHNHQTCNFPTPTRESLTFVVILLDQVAWLYSGYHYGSPTMIYIINRVLDSTFLAIHCFKHSRCHPPSRHSVVNTLCRTSGHCSGNPGQSSRPSETLIPPVKPLETQEQPYLQ